MRKIKFTLLILLVATLSLLWAASHIWYFGIIRHGSPRSIWVVVANGGVYFEVWGAESTQWVFGADKTYPSYTGEMDAYGFAGFGYHLCQTCNREAFIRIPFWFLSSIIFLLTWFVWRRTKPKKYAAFPVQSIDPASKAI